MSTFFRQPSQTDRVTAPSGLPQPEPYLASEDISRTARHRPRRRSRPRPRRRGSSWDDESDSSIDEGRWPRAQTRHRSRSKEIFPTTSDMLERNVMLRAAGERLARQIALEMPPVVERKIPIRQREPLQYALPYPGVGGERDIGEPKKEQDPERDRERDPERRQDRRTRSHRYYLSEDSDWEWRRHVSRKRTPVRTPDDLPKAGTTAGIGSATVVPSHPGLEGQKTHQEPQTPVGTANATTTALTDWRPEQMYNPFSVMPIYPTLSEPLGDARDSSQARIRWLQKKAAGMKENEVLKRIMGLFGLEDFKRFCLSFYERIISVPAPMRPQEAGDIDIFFTGNEGAGQDLAALRYRELLISLEIIPRPSLIHYFSEDPASIATTEQTVKKAVSQKSGSPPKESFVFVYQGSFKEGGHQIFDQVREQTREKNGGLKNVRHIVWIGIGISTSEAKAHHFQLALTTIHAHDLTFSEMCYGLCFLLGFGNSLSLCVEGGPNGKLLVEVMDRIIKGHQSRGTWRQWTTLESTAKMLRARRLGPYWTPSGAISIRALESAGHYYASCHILGEGPDELRARVDEYDQLMQMVGLNDVKKDVMLLVSVERWNQLQRLGSGAPRMSRYQRALLHRCFVGPLGTGRRTVAKLYARILWRLGLVEGMETTTLSLASLVGLSRRAIERRIYDAFEDTKNVGAVIVEDFGVDGLKGTASERYDGAGSEDSDEKDDHGVRHRQDSDDSLSKIHTQTTRYSEHTIRPLVFNFLSATVETLNAKGTGPVLILVGCATHTWHHMPICRSPILNTSNEGASNYHPSMSSCFRTMFPEKAQCIVFQPYSVEELLMLFKQRHPNQRRSDGTDKALPQAPLSSQNEAALREVFSISRLRPSFDNICFVEHLMLYLESHYSSRINFSDADLQDKEQEVLQPSDIYSAVISYNADDTGQSGASADSVGNIFHGLVGLDHIALAFKSLYAMASNLRQVRLQDPRPYIPYLFLFSGPPGTGKTSVVYNVLGPLYDVMGLLDGPEVVACNMSELIHPRSKSTPTHGARRLASRATKDPIQVSKAQVARMVALAFGKVLHIRGHRITDNTSSYADDDYAEDPTVWRDKVLACVSEYLEADGQRWKHKVVVVFEEDDTVGAKPGASDTSLATGPFTRLRFPTITDPTMIIQMLRTKVAKAGVLIQSRFTGILDTANAEANTLAQASNRMDMMLMHIARRPAFSGRELDALAKDIVQFVYGRTMTPPTPPTRTGAERSSNEEIGPIVVSLAQLATILNKRYPDQPWIWKE